MDLWMFEMVPHLIVTGGFFVVFFVIIVSAMRSVIQWSKNNASPVLTVDAKVVTKRENVDHHHSGNNNMAMHTSSTYYATFEVESGDRIELQVSGSEYGMLVEGDSGKLTFQGTRYKGFTRSR